MKNTPTDFELFFNELEEADQIKLNTFFSEFAQNFSVPKKETRKFKADFECAILCLCQSGVSVSDALSRLALSNLGGFYARSSIGWFPLDYAAKIYPIAMEHGAQHGFRISAYMKEDISPELLQMALIFTIKRFPSFATTLKKGFFWHYFDSTKRHFSVIKEFDVPCQPIKVSRSGSRSFRILYYNNRISIECFHALTDGTGAVAFLKSLISEYLRLLKGVRIESADVLNVNDTPMNEEFENAFENVERSEHSSGFKDKSAVQMNGKIAKIRPCRILHLKMDSGKLYEVAKAHGATVTGYLLMQMFYASSASADNLTGDLNIQVPVNMRKYYPSRTVRNFSMYCGIRIPIDKIGDKSELISEISDQLTRKSAKEKMQEMVTATVKLVRSIRFIPLFIKQPIAKIVYKFVGEKVYSTTFSNIGVVKMPAEMSDYVEYMDCCLGPQTINRLACTAITANNVTTFSILKITPDPTFENVMYKLLCEDGIEVTVEGSEYYGN